MMRIHIRLLLLFTVFCNIDSISGYTCDSVNLLGIQKSCPGFGDSLDEEYCCLQDGSYKCCRAEEFLARAGVDIIVIIIIVGVVLGSAIACCLCCLCCPCCVLYKRRHRGTVYGPGMQTTVVTVPQATQAPAGYVHNQPNVPYPIQPMGTVPPQAFSYAGYTPMPQPSEAAQPPPYNVAVSNEGYPKQAPYNPAY